MSSISSNPAETSASRATGQPFLDVRDLRVHFGTEDGLVKSVDGISFQLERGQTLGVVGESGSGKSVTSLSLLGLHKRADRKGRGGARMSGEIWLDGEELISADQGRLQELRGNKMAMIFQDPLSAMHPYYTVGDQLIEAYRVHNKVSKAVARKRAVEMLDRVGIPQPDTRVDDYPHQFSGGMRQRAMIAMSLMCDPQLLIADEPTTALDVTVQAQILDLMRDLQREFNSALIIITHDLGVVAELADNIMVMYGGKAIEYGPAKTVFTAPEHPYTWGLLTSMPRLDRPVQDRLVPIPGSPPSLINVPSGCAFNPRCGYVSLNGERCTSVVPELLQVTTGERHLVRCHLPEDVRQRTFNEEIRTLL
ncbi:ABC transporter ATP-binding protein [Actinospica robiniae]|uniref:ABC transporter ATP-binding protein n=1 Tax=Actinospica robiniae TaxID=304901 RepID=UPI0004110AD0|nr:ABC transporter ATP-binding protein [Actinospica robiniae]